MFVRAKVDFETPTHCVRAGQLVDLPEEQAQDVVKRGHAVACTIEDAIADMSNAQRATAGPDARIVKRGA